MTNVPICRKCMSTNVEKKSFQSFQDFFYVGMRKEKEYYTIKCKDCGYEGKEIHER